MAVPIDPTLGHERALLLFQEELAAVRTDAELQALRARWAGRKASWVAAFMELVGRATADEKRTIGRQANELKKTVEAAISGREEALKATRRPAGAVDITLAGRVPPIGYRHPISLVRDEVIGIFAGLGYQVLEGPEIEDDYHNFEALNMPPEHPARDMQDTFYLSKALEVTQASKEESKNTKQPSIMPPLDLLRTHTSAMQIRHMEANDPPVRLISIGAVYRRDALDLTHSPMFHQCEALVVGPHITLADLKGTLLSMARALFGAGQDVRFRPSFFPYTEPSAEVDIRCIRCQGAGCPICKRTGWVEILGSGMVHPSVFEYVGYDPDRVTGFAFGLGLERVALLKWDIDDIRLLYENDVRFLQQFGSVPIGLSGVEGS